MQKDILDFVKQLSILDKKNLNEKGLKLAEECGELAKELLPFLNGKSTRHRFATGEAVLEEVADVILVALSIGYALGYETEHISEMMKAKSSYWASLIANEEGMADKTPYEIHVTVKAQPDKEQDFIAVCKNLDVKPIVLALQNREAADIKDVMTSSVCYGQNSDAYHEMQRIANGLAENGFEVVRRKIETVPWHPAAPRRVGARKEMPKDCYFESHLAVHVESNEERTRLSTNATRLGCHISRNAFKRYDDGSMVVMMTYRVYSGLYEDFKESVARISADLRDNRFEVQKEIVEFSLFDSNITHDADWTRRQLAA